MTAALASLRQALAEQVPVRQVQPWQGSWDAVESPRRVSLATPAALVSALGCRVVHVAQAVAGAGRLIAGDSPRPVPPSAFELDGIARVTVEVEIASVFISAVPGAGKRGAAAIDLAMCAVPVLVAHALRDIEGSAVDSSALRDKGLSAVVLVGVREFMLNAPSVDRAPLAQVDLGDETVWRAKD